MKKVYKIYDKKMQAYTETAVFSSKPTAYINKYADKFKNGNYELHTFKIVLETKEDIV